MALERADISVLAGSARAHRPLAQVDLLEGDASIAVRRRFRKQRALRQRLADRAFHIAGRQVAAAPDLLVETFQHPPRTLAGFAAAADRDVIAARIRDDIHPPLDQAEMLAILPEQDRREPVVVKGEHDLMWRCSGFACAGAYCDIVSPGISQTFQASAAMGRRERARAGFSVSTSSPSRLLT